MSSNSETECDYYEVLYMPEYGGGLSFPQDFVEEVFLRFPPESKVGKGLWRKTVDLILQEGEEVPLNRLHHYRIIETKEFCNDYKWLKVTSHHKDERFNRKNRSDEYSRYCTKDFKEYYFVECNRFSWRDVPEIIALVREKGLDIPVRKVPKGYDYYIREYDGMECVKIECPTRRIIEDLLGIIAKKDVTIHALTQKLLDGESLINIMNPKDLDFN
jgi:hypothetical protein